MSSYFSCKNCRPEIDPYFVFSHALQRQIRTRSFRGPAPHRIGHPAENTFILEIYIAIILFGQSKLMLGGIQKIRVVFLKASRTSLFPLGW